MVNSLTQQSAVSRVQQAAGSKRTRRLTEPRLASAKVAYDGSNGMKIDSTARRTRSHGPYGPQSSGRKPDARLPRSTIGLDGTTSWEGKAPTPLGVRSASFAGHYLHLHGLREIVTG